MKNTGKVFGIIAIIAVIGFSMAACGGDGGNDGDGDGDGSQVSPLTISNAQVYTRVGNNGTYTYTAFTGTVSNLNYAAMIGSDGYSLNSKPLNELIDGSPTVTLTNGKLNVTLGKPKDSSLQNLDTSTMPQSITISTTGVKYLAILGFYNGVDIENDAEIRMFRNDYAGYVLYYYSNKDVNVSGSGTFPAGEGYTVTITFAMNLKAGWNSVIQTYAGAEVSMKTGTPPADFKWVVNQ